MSDRQNNRAGLALEDAQRETNGLATITERKEADDFRAVVMENMAEGLYTLDALGRVTYLNAAASQMLGWTKDELRGKPMHEIVHFQQHDGTGLPAEDCALSNSRTQGRTIRVVDEAFTRKDGAIFPVAYSSAPLLSGTTIQGVVVVFRDVSEEKKQQSNVQHQLAALSWIGRIRAAIDEDRFVLHSQPIVPLAEGPPGEELLLRMSRPSGELIMREELLLRMIGPSGELILPGNFLAVAETYGLIGEIDRWVIRQAVRRAAAGRRVIELNISAASIGTADLLPFIERQLRDAGTNPRNLVFEVTETALMRDAAAGEAFARGLAEIGCGLALDDFGTGFGGFTLLKNLPISYLKIDIEFVRGLATIPANLHIVRAIVSLARAFGLRTIAEGIEDEDTLTMLRAERVNFGQGFHLGRPTPAST
jgi:PAS domain S-box-containing protein